MGKDWKYIVYLLLAAGIYLFVQLSQPRDINWSVTYHRTDKDPYGTYVLDQLINDIFPEKAIHKSNLTGYELLDSLKGKANFFSISTFFSPDEADAKTILKFADQGGHAFIAAENFSDLFADTLNLEVKDYLFDYGADYFNDSDTIPVTMSFYESHQFYYQRKNIHNYFSSYDSSRTTVLATNDVDYPVLISIEWGEGNIIASSIPIAFTNISLLDGNNLGFAEQALSLLPSDELYWTEFYHLGRLEAASPLRYVLVTEPLRWAYYIAVISLLIFVLFEIKRKQRIIPVIKPLQNTTLEFVGTVGNLYFQSKDHKNIAEKRISFLGEQLRVKHNINLYHMENETIEIISKKTGNAEKQVRELLEIIRYIQSHKQITEVELLRFNAILENFNY